MSSLTDEAGAAVVLATSALLDEAAVCLPAATRMLGPASDDDDSETGSEVDDAARPPEDAPIRSQPFTGPGQVAVRLPVASTASTTQFCTWRKQVTERGQPEMAQSAHGPYAGPMLALLYACSSAARTWSLVACLAPSFLSSFSAAFAR